MWTRFRLVLNAVCSDALKIYILEIELFHITSLCLCILNLHCYLNRMSLDCLILKSKSCCIPNWVTVVFSNLWIIWTNLWFCKLTVYQSLLTSQGTFYCCLFFNWAKLMLIVGHHSHCLVIANMSSDNDGSWLVQTGFPLGWCRSKHAPLWNWFFWVCCAFGTASVQHWFQFPLSIYTHCGVGLCLQSALIYKCDNQIIYLMKSIKIHVEGFWSWMVKLWIFPHFSVGNVQVF